MNIAVRISDLLTEYGSYYTLIQQVVKFDRIGGLDNIVFMG